ncbi:MAG: short-chain dehydrogenase/reductase [Rhodospirillales bacterium]|nr:short-chain dehydrogenase/reductase [Rhodospirillales bacterium]
MGRLDGKVAFVAGASSGIGRATVKRFAAEGATVVFCARRAELIASLSQEIETAGGKGEGIVLDISDLDAYTGALEKTAKTYGKLDIFVHNAMYGSFRMLADTDIEEWRANFRVNADAAFAATMASIRIMTPRGRGSIVNIATIAAVRSVPGLGAYAASKAALISMSETAAMEAAAANVRVNIVIPGVIDTESMRDSFGNDPNIAAHAASRIPMGRFGTPDELANGVLFLASDEASYITGHSLLVDGGKFVQLG